MLDACLVQMGLWKMDVISRIAGGRVLLPGGVENDIEININDGLIDAVGESRPVQSSQTLLADGLLVLPGIVDIHGDAFERQLAPRPEVRFPLAMALADTDRQLLANGITTAFHGITCSWESGLRSRDMARRLLEHLWEGPDLVADNRVHLRFEMHNLDAVEEVLVWMEEGRIDLLAFNDHLPAMLRKLDDPEKLGKYAERSDLPLAEFRKLLCRTAERGAEVDAAVATLAAAARRFRIATASHDDMSREDRLRFQALGCSVCEFPMREVAARTAQELGNDVIMGAPNVVRGGSHLGGVGASTMVRAGVCTVLASDYYYPALPAAPMRLVSDGVCTLAGAWELVSANPARAAGLADRGRIVAGARADLILVDDSDLLCPRVVATLVQGRLRHASGPLRVQ